MSRELISRNAGLIDDREVVEMLLLDNILDGLTMLRDLTEGAVWNRDMFDADGNVRENLAQREVKSGRVAAQHVRDMAEKGIQALAVGDKPYATHYYIRASRMFIAQIRDLGILKKVPPPPHRPPRDPEQCRRLYVAAEKIRREAKAERVGMARACRSAIQEEPTLLPDRLLTAVTDRILVGMFKRGAEIQSSARPA